MNTIIKFLKDNGVAIVCFLSIFVFAIFLHLFGILESFQQFVAVLASAAATYIIVCVTMNSQNKQQLEVQNTLLKEQNKQQLEVQKALLEKQSENENKAKRELEIYNAKLKVYSNYVSEMYKSLGDNHATSDELKDLRTKLFSTVGFYAEGNVLEDIYLKIKDVFLNKNKDKQEYEKIDDKMPLLFSGITRILQNDAKSKGNPNDEKMDAKNDTIVKEESEDDNKKKDIVQVLWNEFQDIINAIEVQEEQDKEDRKKEEQKERIYEKERQSEHDKQNKQLNDSTENPNHEIKLECSVEDEPQYLEKQAWHFNAWDGRQFEQLDKSEKLEEYELSLVEYGESWRTNLVKQVGNGDIIMLFRRGGYGYVGAFEAIGRRIFDFEKGEEEILYFNNPEKPSIVTTRDNKEAFEKDAEKYDIYDSKEDGATLCSNLIVRRLAYVPDGVGNPGGVYRRTISRYDSHYAWLLMERFKNAITNNA